MTSLNNSDSLIDTFSYAATDGNGNFDTTTLRITILGVDDPPVVALDAGDITEDDLPNNVTGNVLANDSDPEAQSLSVATVDGSRRSTSASRLLGTYGSLTLGSDGSYTYLLDNGNPLVDALDDGDTLTESFAYEATDGTGSTGCRTDDYDSRPQRRPAGT